MRKLIIIFGIIGCFFCFYGIGAYLKTYPLSPGGSLYPKISKQQSAVTISEEKPGLPLAQEEQTAATTKPLNKVIEEDKGAKLVERLQAGRLLAFPRLQDSLQRRFAKEYPSTESGALGEAASRVGILQAMSQYSRQALSNDELQAVAQFYQEKTENEAEHPAVRHESLKNLLQLIGRLDEVDRLNILARAGPRLASAARPTNELLEEMFKVANP